MPVGLFTLDVYGHFLSFHPALSKMPGTRDIVPGRTLWKPCFAEAAWRPLDARVHT